MSTIRERQSPSETSFTGALLRLWWMGGTGACFLAAPIIALESDGMPSGFDALFASIVVSMILARYVDIRRYAGSTADGETGTLEHFRKYARTVIATSIVVLGGAHAIALL